MAGRYTPVHSSIWSDPDFIALPPDAQRMYLLIISQPNVSFAGVVGLSIKRWSRMAAGSTEEDVEHAIRVLEDARYVALDLNTEELLIRSFVKHGRIYEQKQLRKALVRAYESILSPALKRAFHAAQIGEVKDLVGSPPEACPPPCSGGSSGGSDTKDLDLDLDLHRQQTAAAEAAVEAELRRRLTERRRRGEDIGPKLEVLIRADVIRDLSLKAEDGTPKCGECGGRFSLGAGWLHSSDCSQARSA